MTAELDQLEAALLDVRKAFRLLYQYNQRVRDLAEIIASSIGWTPIQTFGMTPISLRRPVIGSWSTWDCTPTTDWIFLYPSPESKKTKGRCLSVWISADSGFSNSADCDPTSFLPPELCQSKVYLTFFLARKTKARSWINVWENSGDLEPEDEMKVEVMDEGSPDELKFVWRVLPFSSFRDELTVVATVKTFMREASALLGGEL